MSDREGRLGAADFLLKTAGEVCPAEPFPSLPGMNRKKHSFFRIKFLWTAKQTINTCGLLDTPSQGSGEASLHGGAECLFEKQYTADFSLPVTPAAAEIGSVPLTAPLLTQENECIGSWHPNRTKTKTAPADTLYPSGLFSNIKLYPNSTQFLPSKPSAAYLDAARNWGFFAFLRSVMHTRQQ